MRAAIYARERTHIGQNPEMQLTELRDYCFRRGWEVVGEFVDTGVCRAASAGRNWTACRLHVNVAK